MKKRICVVGMILTMMFGIFATACQPSAGAAGTDAEVKTTMGTDAEVITTMETVGEFKTTAAASTQKSAADAALPKESEKKWEFTPELEAFMEEINREHEAVVKPEVDFAQYTLPRGERDARYSKGFYNVHDWEERKFDGDGMLSMEAVEDDLDIFFGILKTSYGGYYYFGGQEVFTAAQEEVLQRCRETDHLTGNMVVSYLLDALKFVEDCHFSIEGQTLNLHSAPVFYRGTAFEKTKQGYVSMDSGKLVQSVEGWPDLETLFKRSLSDDGWIVYYPIVLYQIHLASREMEFPTPDPLTVHYTDGTSQILSAKPYQRCQRPTEEKVEYHENRGIPVLYSRNWFLHGATTNIEGNQMLSYAKELREKPVMIMDQRYNGGGYGYGPFLWMKTYTGQPVSTNTKTLSIIPMGAYLGSGTAVGSWMMEIQETVGFREVTPDYTEIYSVPETFVDNDNLLVILTSKRSASAAEIFTEFAHNVRNTLVIGENTSGCAIGASGEAELPNSHIRVSFGQYISIFPDTPGYFEEFVGLAPDLWVEGDRAEELAVLFLSNYMQ